MSDFFKGKTRPYTTLSVSKAKVPVKDRKQRQTQSIRLGPVKPAPKLLNSMFLGLKVKASPSPEDPGLLVSRVRRFAPFILSLHILHFYVATLETPLPVYDSYYVI